MIGKTFDIYTITEKRGEGGMGIFYKAHDERLDRIVGLKTLHPDLVSDPDFVEKLEREAKSLARLNHNNIVTIFQYLICEGHHFIVMEYVEGRTVSEAIADWGPYSFTDAAKIVLQILDAIGYAHKNNVIHRDIKPSNILLDTEGTVKVTDFGIAKLVDSAYKTRTGQAAGSLYYMSPEQIQHGELDGRTDIYSLGATFFEMLTGVVPFSAESEFAIMKKHLEEPPPPPSRFNSEISKLRDELIMHAMAKTPAERFSSAGDFANAIRDALSFEDTGTGRVRPKKKRKREKKAPPPEKTFTIKPTRPEIRQPSRKKDKSSTGQSKARWVIYPVMIILVAVAGYMLFSPQPEPELPPIIIEPDTGTTVENIQDETLDESATRADEDISGMEETSSDPEEETPADRTEEEPAVAPPAAVLTINATPFNRQSEVTGIWIDGRRVASGTPYKEANLARGLHWVKIETNFGTWTDTATWTGVERDLDFFLSENTAGRVSIAARFPDDDKYADIYIDDVDISWETPHSIPGLPVGPHKIEVKRDGYQAVGGPRIVRLEMNALSVTFRMRRQ